MYLADSSIDVVSRSPPTYLSTGYKQFYSPMTGPGRSSCFDDPYIDLKKTDGQFFMALYLVAAAKSQTEGVQSCQVRHKPSNLMARIIQVHLVHVSFCEDTSTHSSL